MLILVKLLAFIFIAAGFITVFAARWAVGRFGLDGNMKCEFEEEMNEEELKQYKFDKAVVNLKMMGMLAALPGIILLLVVFR